MAQSQEVLLDLLTLFRRLLEKKKLKLGEFKHPCMQMYACMYCMYVLTLQVSHIQRDDYGVDHWKSFQKSCTVGFREGIYRDFSKMGHRHIPLYAFTNKCHIFQ